MQVSEKEMGEALKLAEGFQLRAGITPNSEYTKLSHALLAAQAKIDEQQREIERLTDIHRRGALEAAVDAKDYHARISTLEAQLAGVLDAAMQTLHDCEGRDMEIGAVGALQYLHKAISKPIFAKAVAIRQAEQTVVEAARVFIGDYPGCRRLKLAIDALDSAKAGG